MFPLIPLFALFAIFTGTAGLVWYEQLSKEEKEKADRIACGYAKEIFNKSLNNLTEAEADRVAELTREHFES